MTATNETKTGVGRGARVTCPVDYVEFSVEAMPALFNALHVDVDFGDGEEGGGRRVLTLEVAHTVSVGQCRLRVILLGGHPPGAMALLYEDPLGHPHLFSGDCLFPGGVGKTWSEQDFETLFGGVRDRVFASLPDETWVYPGHGNDTTLGAERPALATWEARGW